MKAARIPMVHHIATYDVPREAIVKWLRLNAPSYQFNDQTAKDRLAFQFAVYFCGVYTHELEAAIEQAVARE